MGGISAANSSNCGFAFGVGGDCAYQFAGAISAVGIKFDCERRGIIVFIATPSGECRTGGGIKESDRAVICERNAGTIGASLSRSAIGN